MAVSAERSEHFRQLAGRRNASLTPERRSEIASMGGHAAHALETHVRAVVDRAPELTAGQRDRLALLLRGGAA